MPEPPERSPDPLQTAARQFRDDLAAIASHLIRAAPSARDATLAAAVLARRLAMCPRYGKARRTMERHLVKALLAELARRDALSPQNAARQVAAKRSPMKQPKALREDAR